MPTLKNNTGQPCYIYLLKGKSLKIPARKTAEVSNEDMNCPDMAYHLGSGNLSVMAEKADSKAGSGKEAVLKGKKVAQPILKADAKSKKVAAAIKSKSTTVEDAVDESEENES